MTYALAYQLGWADEYSFGPRAGICRHGGPDESGDAGDALGARVRSYAAAPAPARQSAISNAPYVSMHRYADAYALMGGIMTYIGRPADGIAPLRSALILNPDAGSLYFLLLGRAYYFLGDLEQARVNLDQALTRNAQNLEARVYLAAVFGQFGDRPAAAWQVDEIRAIEPKFDVRRWLATYPMTDARQKDKLVLALRPLGF